MKILIFDNYDSFTYNLVHLVEKIMRLKVDVIRNDQLPLEKAAEYDKIILSPGPGIPSEAGLLLPLVKEYAATKSILGVCLGHQAIGEAFGGTLVNLEQVYHGVATEIKVKGEMEEGSMGLSGETKGGGRKPVFEPVIHYSPLFEGLPGGITVGRYHSWIVSDDNFPAELEVTARDENGYIMALQHKNYDVQGVQFHPESVLTPDGEAIMRNWLAM